MIPFIIIQSKKLYGERVGVERRISLGEIQEFKDFVERNHLVDVGLQGRRFTWYKSNGLARAVLTGHWSMRIGLEAGTRSDFGVCRGPSRTTVQSFSSLLSRTGGPLLFASSMLGPPSSIQREGGGILGGRRY